MLVVADADHDRKKRMDQLERGVGRGQVDVAVFCVPDPPIEMLYVLDEKALEHVAGVHLDGMPGSRVRNCKLLFKQIVEETGSILGGVEYSGDLAQTVDL